MPAEFPAKVNLNFSRTDSKRSVSHSLNADLQTQANQQSSSYVADFNDSDLYVDQNNLQPFSAQAPQIQTKNDCVVQEKTNDFDLT